MIGQAHARKKAEHVERGPLNRMTENSYDQSRQKPDREVREEIAQVKRLKQSVPPYGVVKRQIVEPFGKAAEQDTEGKDADGDDGRFFLCRRFWRPNTVQFFPVVPLQPLLAVPLNLRTEKLHTLRVGI